jgi:glyoxylase-like metal-dependent hydrolase (beta-lactamase superfamily II)
VLLSADALWEQGFGVVFPEVEGEPGFDDVGAVLEQIAALPVQIVVPGHGAPFADVAGALERARRRLDSFRREPARHARHAVKVLVKYHVMEEGSQPLAELVGWALATPLLAALWQRQPPAGVATPQAWIEQIVGELVEGGALARHGERIVDGG